LLRYLLSTVIHLHIFNELIYYRLTGNDSNSGKINSTEVMQRHYFLSLKEFLELETNLNIIIIRSFLLSLFTRSSMMETAAV
jgi:hypothetical protein